MNQLLETGKGKSSGDLSADKISNCVGKAVHQTLLHPNDELVLVLVPHVPHVQSAHRPSRCELHHHKFCSRKILLLAVNKHRASDSQSEITKKYVPTLGLKMLVSKFTYAKRSYKTL